MASYIWLQTADGSLQQVEQEIGKCCPLIWDEMKSGVGTSKNHPISLPSRVTPALLSLIFDYCRFHKEPGHSAKEMKLFDEKFIRIETQRLIDVAAAANSLKLRPLVDITSRALARMIEGKSTEEIRETFNFPDDLTEEEKLQPLDNTIDDAQIRRLNILYARKRKELQEKEKLKNAEVEVEHADARSVDELLSFINGDSKGVQTSKSKKKNRKRKDQQKNLPSSCKSSADRNSSSKNANNIHNKVSNHSDGSCHSFKGRGDSLLSRLEAIKLSGIGDDEFDDLDDDIDPVMKAEIDREVEDFARRLNSDWPQRIQEIHFLGRERRPIPISSMANP